MAKRAANLGRLAGLVAMAAIASYSASAQPRLEFIFNAASGYIDHPEGPAELAQGSLFAVSGSALGPDVPRTAEFPLPLDLGGVSIRVTVGDTTRAALMVEAGPRQLIAILPSDVPLGEGVLSISYGGETSAPARVRLVRRAFGMFDPVYNVDSEAGEVANSFTAAAHSGQIAILWGTGLGPVAGDESTRPLPGALESEVQVLIGDQAATVLYAGRSGCCAGLDQIVFEVPSGPEGCRVPIAVRFSDGDLARNMGSMSIAAAGGTCSDPHGLSAPDREKLRVTQGLKIGTFLLRPGGAWADFFQVVGGNTGAAWASWWWGPGRALPPFGTCFAEHTLRGAVAKPAAAGSAASPPRISGLNAGPFLNVAGPQGATQWRQEHLVYIAPSSVSFGPGDYAVDNGAGGPDIRPFRTIFRVPPLSFRWSNRELLGSRGATRADGLTIAWEGEGLAGGYVVIQGWLQTWQNLGEPTHQEAGSEFFCTERGEKAQFTVPPYVLESLLPRYVGPFTELEVFVTARSLPQKLQIPGLDVTDVVVEEVSQMAVLNLR